MDDSWFRGFIKTAVSELRRKGKTFAYTYEQRDEILKIVKGSKATYDDRYGCYWITLTGEEKKSERTLDSSKKRTKRK